uniref:Uncharacterized protein n=1 Tax=Pseudonaja textilis TaxID=8673 RepID=A0A670ZEA3_PSETE
QLVAVRRLFLPTHPLTPPPPSLPCTSPRELRIFDCSRLKFSEIPQRLTNLLLPPDPIVINHIISVDPNDQKKTACYDIDVEVEDPLKGQMSSFLLSTANQQEITALDNKIHETIESINQLKIQRDFMLSFSRDPKGYIQDLLRSQSRDLKVGRAGGVGFQWLEQPVLWAWPKWWAWLGGSPDWLGVAWV